MAMSMAVIVIFMPPVTFVVAPAFPIVVVMWVGPGCARIGWSLVASGHPTIVVTLRCPEASHPDHADGRRWRWRRFIRYRWRRNPDIYRNLGRCGSREGQPKKKRDQTAFFHACPPFDSKPVPWTIGMALPVKTSTHDITDATAIAQWRISGIAETTLRTNSEEHDRQAVGGEARPLIASVAGAYGRAVESTGRDLLLEHPGKPAQV